MILTLNPHHDEARGPASAVLSASFSPDGLRLVTAHGDCNARVWDANTGAMLRSFEHRNLRPGSPCAVWSASFSPDGRRIVTADEDGIARVWDADSGEMEFSLSPLHANPEPWSASFSPDGRQIVTAFRLDLPAIWDANDGKRLFPTKDRYPGSLAGPATQSPDGRWLITVNGDGVVLAWDPVSLGVVFEITIDDDRAWSSFPSTQAMDTGSALHDTAPGKIRRMTEELWCATPLCLSPEERAELLGESGGDAARGAAMCAAEVVRHAAGCDYPGAMVTLVDSGGIPHAPSPAGR